MYKDFRYINAGTNEYYRWGGKAMTKLERYLEPNENGFYSIPCNGGKYWTIGTSKGKYGEFAKFEDTFFSVNSMGRAWAKVGTPKAEAFVKMIHSLLDAMANEGHGASHLSGEDDSYRYDDGNDDDMDF